MASEHSEAKPWGGRFTQSTDTLMERFSESVSFDQRLYPYDIDGSVAHATMLTQVGVLTEDEGEAIVVGLETIRADIEAGQFEWRIELEDVHMNIEAALTERIGETGKKLHTARSRNDQVATDVRLLVRDEIDAVIASIRGLQTVVVDIAAAEVDTIMPGFTHLQSAQPVTLGHHLLAWYEMLERDAERFGDCRRRTNRMPLGAAALAGTSFPIDRAMTAELLGFEAICANSLDAVADRDFCIEFAAHAALLMVHLSRFSEELILWTSPQFDFVELSDAFCTGSSIMPQKKNPDAAELVRGKSGRVVGHLTALLVVMKAQPLTFNRDNQEDKQALFDCIDTVKACLAVYTAMLPGMSVKREHMFAAARRGHATATDLADYLVRKNIPFRDAHAVVGQVVRAAVAAGRELSDFSLAELKAFSSDIAADVHEVLTLEGSVSARSHLGGTAPARVREAVEAARCRLREV